MRTPPAINDVRKDINEVLAQWYAKQTATAKHLDETYAELWQHMTAFAQNSGKRIRPYLTVLSYVASGGTDYTSIIKVGAGEELLHTSLLIHDDIIDRDLTRYSQPNIAGVYQKKYAALTTDSEAGHYAMSAALLAGDLALSGSYQLIMQSDFSAEQKLLALEHLSNALFTVVGGEFLDSEAALLPTSETKSLVIAELKTASYSFVGPLLLGAALAGANQQTKEYYIKLGTALGTAYQLSDDLLGLFGEEAVTGKPITSDIREGKQTYLLQKILASCTASEKQFIEQKLHDPEVTESDVRKIRYIAEHCGAKYKVEARIQTYAKEAMATLQLLSLSEALQQAFEAMIEKALWRNK